jgi:hypothetical protein
LSPQAKSAAASANDRRTALRYLDFRFGSCSYHFDAASSVGGIAFWRTLRSRARGVLDGGASTHIDTIISAHG